MKLRCVVTYMHQNYRLHINLIKLKVIITISIILKRLDKKYMLVWVMGDVLRYQTDEAFSLIRKRKIIRRIAIS